MMDATLFPVLFHSNKTAQAVLGPLPNTQYLHAILHGFMISLYAMVTTGENK